MQNLDVCTSSRAGVFIVSLLEKKKNPKNLSSFTQAEFKVTEVNYMQSRYW